MDFLKKFFNPVGNQNDQSSDNSRDTPDKLLKRHAKITRILIPLSFLGLIIFLVLATAAPFKDRLLSTLYPKPKSQAQEQTTSSQQNQPKFQGYIIEFKDDSVMEHKRKTQPTEKINRQPLLDYEKNTLLPSHERAKNDVLSRIAAIKPQQAKILREYTKVFNGIVLDIDESGVAEVKKSPYVKNVYKNLEVQANLNNSVPLIGADEVWQLKDNFGKSITGEGVNIAVLDTGVDYTHPDLGNTQITERNFVFSPSSDVPDITSDQQFAIDSNRIIWIVASVSLGNQTILGTYKFGDTSIKSVFLTNPPNMTVKRLTVKDNYIVYFGTTLIQSETGLYIYDLNTEINRLIAAAGLVGNISISNGRVVYLRSKSASLSDLGNVGVYIYDLQTGSEVLIEAGSFGYLGNPFISNNLLAYSNSGCSNRVVIYDLNNQTKKEISLATTGYLTDFKGDQILYFSCNQIENKFYLHNIVTGNSTTISPPNLAGTPSSTPLEIKNTSSVGISFGFLEEGSIQDGIIYFTKSPNHNRVMAYDQIKNRYVQINILSTSGAMAAEGKTICFRASNTKINCHVYDSNYDYPIPTEIFNNKIVGGYNFIDNNTNPLDDHGHGTHVAATIAGNGVLKGVGPGANLIAYKVLNAYGSGYFANIMSALDKAVSTRLDGDSSNDIDIISMSLGADCGQYTESCGPDDPLSRSVDNAVQAGITAVIAAGNSGPSSSTIGSPGTARKAITVGAVDKSKQLASFSSRGPVVYNGETINKPDVVAPGVLICAAEWDSWLTDKRCIDDKHIAINGTSMATPHVAGVAALIKQARPGWSPDQIKDAIKQTADNLGLTINEQGAGLVNALSAVSVFTPTPTPTLTPTPTPTPTPPPCLNRGLAGYWKLNETFGKIAKNSSSGGSAYNGILYNFAWTSNWQTNGKYGGSLLFDGINDYVRINAITGLTAVHTTTFWMKPAKIAGGLNMYFINMATNGSNNNWIQLYDVDNDGKLEIRAGSSGVTGGFLDGNYEFTQAGTWYFVAVTVDTTAMMNIYVNGLLDKSGKVATSTPSYINVGSFQPANNPFNGEIDELRIYNQVLSAESIDNLYRCIPP